ncbi:heme/copper-type cytochrome/quinol oxidase subunit 2 [Psychromicrobium silvestre]|uniref:Heme/copper-type cytochrome/quinol oxidase subunit 2 n=1 Tax=Psychromicrobium silvestre TaxID=1645614 RepID=A0A7Y9LUW7_9MICC|nr:hypothetical protein [Psychromicrobium silvestre]NYE95985.1 heme/copper-type cytochrome/quinol oxidase subunit 2 [Psychromicrobium silvestre]
MATAGASILWNGAEGRGVVHANITSIAIFILVLGAILVLYSLAVRVRRTESAHGYRLPTVDRWLLAVRNILFVVIAVFSAQIDNYFIQWMICFAALLLSVLGAAGAVLSVLRREDGSTTNWSLANLVAGILGLIFSAQVHGWDPNFITPLLGLILVPAFISWTVKTAIKP